MDEGTFITISIWGEVLGTIALYKIVNTAAGGGFCQCSNLPRIFSTQLVKSCRENSHGKAEIENPSHSFRNRQQVFSTSEPVCTKTETDGFYFVVFNFPRTAHTPFPLARIQLPTL